MGHEQMIDVKQRSNDLNDGHIIFQSKSRLTLVNIDM